MSGNLSRGRYALCLLVGFFPALLLLSDVYFNGNRTFGGLETHQAFFAAGVWCGLGVAAGIVSTLLASLIGAPEKSYRLLKAFAYFCPRQGREHFEIVVADLRKDVREMRAEKRSERFIRMIVAWHVARTLVPFVWDGVKQGVAKALLLSRLIGPR